MGKNIETRLVKLNAELEDFKNSVSLRASCKCIIELNYFDIELFLLKDLTNKKTFHSNPGKVAYLDYRHEYKNESKI